MLALLRAALRNLFRRRSVERDLQLELEATLELLAAEKIEQGLDAESARRAARRELGSLDNVSEQVREIRAGARLESLARDFRFAARLLRRRTGFALLIVLTLALGVGAASSLFALINTLVFRPLPFPHEERLVRVRLSQSAGDGATSRVNVPGPIFATLERELSSWTAAVALDYGEELLRGADPPRRISCVGVTHGWQATLGVAPQHGRWFSDEEFANGAGSAVAVVAWSLARDLFGDPAAAVGQRLKVERGELEIVGVLPPRFRFPYTAEAWTPVRADSADSAAVFVRLARGVPLSAARAEAAAIAGRLPQLFSRLGPGFGVDLEPARRSLMAGEERVSWALAGVAFTFLLIACLNAALLFLARALTRRDELAMRSALGAERRRLVQQLFAESLLLALVGTALGIGLLALLAPQLQPLLPSNFQEELGLGELVVDHRLVLLVGGILAASALAFGLVPALRVTRQPLIARLAGSGRSASGSATGRLVSTLVTAQVAAALAVLLGTFALGRHLRIEADRPTGIDTHGLMSMQVVPPSARLSTPEQRGALVEELLARLRGSGEISAVAVASSNPLAETTWVRTTMAESNGRETLANMRLVTPAWLSTVRLALRGGRAIGAADRAGSEPVALVSASLAHHLWPGGEALGRRLRVMRPGADWLTVIGVVDDTLESSELPATLYFPWAQQTDSAAASWIDLFLRPRRDDATAITAVRSVLASLDPDAAIVDLLSMEELRSRRMGSSKIAARVGSLFSGLALAMASLGLFGVTALALRLRQHELAIRLALGARPLDMAARVASHSARLVAIGVAFGLPLGLALVRLLESVLPNLQGFDGGSTLIAVATLTLTALTAAVWPAARALRVDPAATLRNQ